MNRFTCSHLRAALLLAMGLGAHGASADAFRADFNGDGFEDFVVGVPWEDVDGVTDAGAVKVVYGEAHGEMDQQSPTQYFHQWSPGARGIELGENAEPGDHFGHAVAVGDFNADGFDDLAISASKEEVGSVDLAGLVTVVYGSANGLDGQDFGLVHLGQIADGFFHRRLNQFGHALVVGDFDGDGVEDLAASFVGRFADDRPFGGGVVLMFGERGAGLDGVRSSPKTYVALDSRNWFDNSHTGFGGSLASGDVNDDGIDDLVVGAYNRRLGGVDRVGAVYVAFGTASWKRRRGPTFSRRLLPPVGGFQMFGRALAVGHFNERPGADIGIGAPQATVGDVERAGAVYIATLGDDGQFDLQQYHQNWQSIPGRATWLSEFGAALTAADFNGDGRDELAIGIPGKDKNFRKIWVGEVVVLEGASNNPFRAQVWHQDMPDMQSRRETSDAFGRALGAGDIDNDGLPDLLIGAPGEGIYSVGKGGIVQVVYGHADAVTTASGDRPQIFHQGSFSGAGFGSAENELRDHFGGRLAQ